uniref:CXXC-type domain-containing protein n=1 Tax=Acrobeloides nanus TaxID=290746 RepID=A0A914EI47_9BILA
MMDGSRPPTQSQAIVVNPAQCMMPPHSTMPYPGVHFPPHLVAAAGLSNYRPPPVPAAVASASSTPTTTTSSMNRSQRCGVCRGCQCKPCGTCTYCQDSPQFGGPGVKKQSCIERRCLRVLENRLQRDAPTFKARVGCNNCDDCRMADCQICLVCLDKRFFDNRYMTGALCAKKRCNNATSLEIPAAQNSNSERQMLKRSYENNSNYDYMMAKRRGVEGSSANGAPTITHTPVNVQMPPAMPRVIAINGTNGVPDPSAYSAAHLQSLRILHQPQTIPGAHQMNLLMPMTTVATITNGASLTEQQSQQQQSNGTIAISQPQQEANNTQTVTSTSSIVTSIPSMPPQFVGLPTPMPHPNGVYTTFLPHADMAAAAAMSAAGMQPHFAAHYPPHKLFGYPKYEYYETDTMLSPQDPFVPPSYAPEMKNAVVLQPL